MKRQNSEKRLINLGKYSEFNCFKSNPRVNKRFKSINFYKNNKLEYLIRKEEAKNNAQNIFELINFHKILLNHYKNYKLYFDKPEEGYNKYKKRYIKFDDIKLGKEGFGKYYLFRAIEKEDMNFYAGKIIKKETISKDLKTLLSDPYIPINFNNHPKIVKIKDYFEDYKNDYIILELCKNKSLAEYLEHRGGKLTEIEVKCYIFQLLQVLNFLHKNRAIHRDLKPSNLLLDEKNELKIGDFDKIALILDKDRRYTVCGTYNYMAPEIFENNGKGYSFKVDIWSVGVIMYQLLTGKLPFNGENNVEIQKNILSFQPEGLNTSELSLISADLIKQILVKDPTKRPGINQILYHYFFHDIEFPKYITPENLNKIEKEEKEEKEKNNEIDEEKMKKLEMKLYNLIIDDVPQIEYENIKNYVIKESNDAYEYYITYRHNSLKHNYCYFEFNNEIIGIIFNDNEGENINMLYNTETELFYHININEDNDEIKKYMKKEIPDELKKNVQIFLKIYELSLKKKAKIKANDENASTEEQISELNSLSNENSIISQNRVLDKDNLIYVRKIIFDKNANVFFLSDRTIEAYFVDKYKILISEINDKIEIIQEYNKINVIDYKSAFKTSNHDLNRRMKYLRKLLYKNAKDYNDKYNKDNNPGK